MLPALRRLTVLALVFSLGGCKPPPDAEAPPVAAAPPVKAQAPEGIEYAGWPLLTAKPIPVVRKLWLLCRIPDENHPLVKESKSLGPHARPAIRVYANPIAHTHLRDNRPGALPVGAVIIKEKLTDLKDEKPFAYAAMIKKEAGYDPDNGDWEYLYDPLREGEKIERGKLTSCIDCHRQAAAKDYLFRKYDGK